MVYWLCKYDLVQNMARSESFRLMGIKKVFSILAQNKDACENELDADEDRPRHLATINQLRSRLGISEEMFTMQ